MRTRRSDNFTTITVEGQILPADLLQRIVEKDGELGGLTPESYHLSPGETVNEATSRAWNKLTANWSNFKNASAKLPANDPGTTITRDRWLLPLFQELGYGRLPATRAAVAIDGKSYAISHWWANVPIHLVGCGVSLDRLSARVAGAARSSPHSLIQELLNRSQESLWGFVSNGLQLRILRDNQNLVRQAYVEFDLEAMMDGEGYSDFVMLWLLCHQSRVEGENPNEYWLERWSRAAQEQGVRALDHLREGVEEAILQLGSGFLSYRANTNLRERLRSGELDKQDYYRQLLRLVYRLLFLFVAEDRTDDKGRSLIFDPPNASQESCDRYTKFYSTKKLRTLAERRHGSRHSDLYAALQLVMVKLGSDGGCRELALPALGSFLFSKEAIPDLIGCEIANHDLLDAVRSLAFAADNQARRQVDYKNLGSEELGSVYESLLELHPQLNVDAGSFTLSTAAGHERKTTGSYYTHDSLVQCLLDSALDPVLADRERNHGSLGYKSKEEAILDLKVCDPACGSGHFLIAAAHRIAKRVAAIRTGDDEPSPEATRHAVRDVVGRCLYGIDINPMAVELCKVSLWMEALEPGRPLSFLDHHIQCGNSLLGTTPRLIDYGIPDEALRPIEEDDTKLCAEYRKQNKRERKQETLRGFHEAWEQFGNLATSLMSINEIADDTIEGVRKRQERYASLVNSSGYRYGGLLADAWCAAFLWTKRKSDDLPYAITEEVFRRIEENPFSVPKWMEREIQRLANQYQFFHWHLAFPDVFHVTPSGENLENAPRGWNGGFDVILGNPPWERVKLQDREWFAQRRPDIAQAANAAARKRMVNALQVEDPRLYEQFKESQRQADGEGHFMRNTTLFPLCGRGDINLYAVFVEQMRNSLSRGGRLGCIVQSDIATSDTCRFFFDDLVRNTNLVSFFDFVNTEALFPDLHRTHPHFCLLTIDARPQQKPIEFAFWNTNVAHLRETERRFSLSADEIALLNPNTRTCPVFRSRRDAELTKAIYRRIPNFKLDESGKDSGWQAFYLRLIDYSDHAESFLSWSDELADGATRPTALEPALPIYESKMMHAFDSRYASYQDGDHVLPLSAEEKADPTRMIRSKFLFPASDFEQIIVKYRYNRRWLLAVRELTNTTNERTVIAAALPRTPVFRNTTVVVGLPDNTPAYCLLAQFNSFSNDYLARQALSGTHLSFGFLKQLPALTPATYAQPCAWVGQGQTLQAWLLPRVLELTYTAWDLEPFAQDCGWTGPPFRWDEERRFLLRCELDAAFFYLYGLNRDDAAYILDTFPIVRRRDEDKFNGDYRTKRVILEIYDEIADAITNGTAYQTHLDPPPGDLRVAHAPRVKPVPLVIPPAIRYPQPDVSVYMMRVVLSMLQQNNGAMDVERLMNACELLSMPDRLETYGSTIEPNLAHRWRSSFNDEFKANLFLLKIDDLVQRGEIKLTRDGTRFKVTRIGTAVLPTDAHIDFDAGFALRVSDSLPQAEKDTFTPLATRDQIEERTRAA